MPRVHDEELEFVFNLSRFVRKLSREDRAILMEEFLTEVADTLREALKLETPVRRRRKEKQP